MGCKQPILQRKAAVTVHQVEGMDPVTLDWIKSLVTVGLGFLVSQLPPLKRLNERIRSKIEEGRKPTPLLSSVTTATPINQGAEPTGSLPRVPFPVQSHPHSPQAWK